MNLPAIIAAGAFLVSSPALAQFGNPAGMDPATPVGAPGKPAPHHPNTQDKLFVYLMVVGGMAEVSAGQLAGTRAQNPAVGRFARMMVDDHSKSNDRLGSLAKQAGIPLPKDLDPDHKAMAAHLESLSGAQFDLAYMQAQLTDHQKAVQILQWEIGQGQSAELQRFASDTLPAVLHHLETAQAIIGDLTGSGPQGLGATLPAARAR
ncbi:MAG: DUF4142 domain-containing protein [Burkholderiales bacterium]